MKFSLYIAVFVAVFNYGLICERVESDFQQNCEKILNASIRAEIQEKSKIVEKIIQTIVNGNESGKTYDQLAKFVDTFGPRFVGTETLEKSIDYLVGLLKREGLEVRTEEVEVPVWQRGKEWARILMPRKQKIGLLGLGGSVGTGASIKAPVMVVGSFEELDNRSHEVNGNIVLFDYKYDTYFASVKYRDNGASKASMYGAVAVLVRSVTPFSIHSPHAGTVQYAKGDKRIPAAAITIEDADMIRRMSKRGIVLVELSMSPKLPNKTSISRNIIADIKGWKYPNEAVIISGHLDSWDVGQGAMDDGGGVFISLRALIILKRLGLKPKRTLRAVLWTAEEIGLLGAYSYIKEHMNEMENVSIAMESDNGTFTPFGLIFSCKNPKSRCVVQDTLQLLSSINTTSALFEVQGSDLIPFLDHKVPIANLYNDDSKYSYYHHTDGDTMTVYDSKQLDSCTALWTASSFVFADLENKLWR